MFLQPHSARLPIGLYSRCIAWNEKFGSHSEARTTGTTYQLALASGAGRKSTGGRVFVKGFIEGAGASLEDRKGLTGFKIELGGSIERMNYMLAAEGAAAAAAGGAGGGSGGAGSAAEVESGAALQIDKSPSGGGTSFSFGGLLSKAKKFSLLIDSKTSSAAAAAAVVTESETKQPSVSEPVGGWRVWLRFANRFTCGR